MEDCFCGERAWYFCRPCRYFLCKKHKKKHQLVQQKIHVFEKLGIKLTPEQMAEVWEDLSKKIQTLQECENKIVSESERQISKINKMCTQALRIVKEKQQKYAILMIDIQKRITEEKMKEIDLLSLTSLVVTAPIHFGEISRLYNTAFLTEINNENIYAIASMPIDNAKIMLEKDYGLFLQAHTGRVYTTIITSDNKYIISCSEDYTVRVWNLKHATQEAVLRGHTNVVFAIAITTNNKYVVSASGDKTIRIWNLQTKVLEAILEGHTSVVVSIAITSDNKYIVSGSYDTTVRIWSLQYKNMVATLKGHTGSVLAMALTSDNKYIVTGSDDSTVIIWNFENPREKDLLQGHTKAVRIVLITSDNEFIVSGSLDCTIRIWSIQYKTQEAVLQGHTGPVLRLLLTSDSKHIISGSEDRTVRVWNLQKKKQECVFEGHSSLLHSQVITSMLYLDQKMELLESGIFS